MRSSKQTTDVRWNLNLKSQPDIFADMRITPASLVLGILLLSGCLSREDRFARYKQAGEDAFARGEFRLAREKFLGALEFNTSDRDVLYMIGLSYRRDNIFDSAQLFLKRADLYNPGDSAILHELYQTAMVTQSWQVALDAVLSLLHRGEPLEKYIDQMVALYRSLKFPSPVAYYLRQLVDKFPDSLRFRRDLVTVLCELDSVPAANGVLDTAFTHFGEIPPLIATRAEMYVYQNRLEEAADVYRYLLRTDSLYATQYTFFLANTLMLQARPDRTREAITLYQEIKPVFPDQPLLDSLLQVADSLLQAQSR